MFQMNKTPQLADSAQKTVIENHASSRTNLLFQIRTVTAKLTIFSKQVL